MQTFEQLQKTFNSHLLKQQFNRKPVELYEPFSYMIQLGGKRIRPVLLLMACETFGTKAKTALPQAVAIELFHNFTLIHDDIMDHAAKRRGQPSVHKKFGNTVAILSGDAMLVYAYRYLIQTSPDLIPKILNVFNECAIKVCEGQQMDMNFESSWKVSVTDYLRMIELKTATLLSSALKIGALVSGASIKDADHLYQFGKELGLAFQIKDDLLDTFGNEEKTGKKGGGDIIQNKRTFLFLTAMNQANSPDRKRLKELYSTQSSNSEKKIDEVVSIFKKLDIEKFTANQAQSHFLKAKRHVNKLTVSDKMKYPLLKISNALMQREY